MLTPEVIESNKQEFLKICRENIKCQGIEDLLNWLENSSDFFTAPGSTIYHSAYPGGLVEHSLNVYKFAKELKDNVNPKLASFDVHAEQVTDEDVAIAALFHDICKVNYYVPCTKWKKDDSGSWASYQSYKIEDKFPCGHGEKSVIILQQFMRLTGQVILGIRWHMGSFSEGTMSDIYQKQAFLQALEYPLTLMLCIADQYATFMMEERKHD